MTRAFATNTNGEADKRSGQFVAYTPRTYVLTNEESKLWDCGASHERHRQLASLSDRLAREHAEWDGCTVRFCHANGDLLGKTVLHHPLFAHTP